jgi:dihydrofolate reductase
MGKIIAFTIVSVDGYFAGPNGEIDWFKGNDEEDRQFSAEASRSGGTLIFGRTTYEMMAAYWPTPDAIKNDPVTAGVMNSSPKIVFSRSMKPVADGPIWRNTRIIHEIKAGEILKMKRQGDGDFVILGSGSIVQQFANLGLIDEYQLMVTPIILGAGKYLFKDVRRMNLSLLDSRTFSNGKIFLRYRPA